MRIIIAPVPNGRRETGDGNGNEYSQPEESLTTYESFVDAARNKPTIIILDHSAWLGYVVYWTDWDSSSSGSVQEELQ